MDSAYVYVQMYIQLMFYHGMKVALWNSKYINQIK